ncbi:MAG TPA: phytase [Acidimicrobiia bacterium]|nr:phytase [Acidimicrobiia bacterium]
MSSRLPSRPARLQTRLLSGALVAALTATVALLPGLSRRAGADAAAGLGVVTNIAGTGVGGWTGDGGPATAARLSAPRHLVVAGDGSLFVADGGNNVVRRIAPNGTITTVAGNGTAGSSGDGGPATEAAINLPHAVAVDGTGHLFIADSSSARVRMVGPDGIITTVVGTGAEAFSGDGGPGTQATIKNPKGLKVGPDGALYISDGMNHRVRRLGLDGIITTVAGNGNDASAGDGGPAKAASLRTPRGLDFDAAGNLYVADGDGNRVRRIGTDGVITTVAGTGTPGYTGDGVPGVTAGLSNPHGVVVDPSGRLLVADTDNHRIRMVDLDGKIWTVSGTGQMGDGPGRGAAVYSAISDPRGLAVDGAGRLYVADTGNARIRRVTDPTPAPLGLWVGDAHAVAETDPVAGEGDAADDPAIWVDPADPSRSLIIGTDKAADNLEIYDLTGRRRQQIPDRDHTINNVDAQADFALGDRRVGLIATGGSDIAFYAIDPATGIVSDVTTDAEIHPTYGTQGICLYTSRGSGKTYVFATAYDGQVQQFEVVVRPDGKVGAVSVRGPWDINPAPDYVVHDGELEACTVDDETGTLYLSEQAVGIWAYGAEPTDSFAPADRTMFGKTTAYGGPITADIEGLAVVPQPGGGGWIIASSQGSDQYVVFDRRAPHAYVRTLKVTPAGTVDGCTRTDGLDAVATDLGGAFNHGLFVCQDNLNTLVAGTTKANQNFKLVPLQQVVPLAAPEAPLPATTTTTTNSSGASTTTTTTKPKTTTTTDPEASTDTTAPGPTTTTSTTTGTPGGPPGQDFHRAGSGSGYWMVDAGGRVYPFGDAKDLGAPGGRLAPGAAAVDLEPTPSSGGYWVLADNGRVYPFGDAVVLPDPAGALRPGETAAALSATPSGRGYWVFTTRGRVLAFGDAPFLGDVSTLTLAGAVLDSIATPSGGGYYMVAADGGIFAFGDAAFFGSMGGQRLNAPVQSLVPDPDGRGYWLVASDGGVFAFQADFRGSMGGRRLNAPVTGMVPYGDGYLMVGSDGGVFDFSTKPFAGSLGSAPPARPVVAVAAVRG